MLIGEIGLIGADAVPWGRDTDSKHNTANLCIYLTIWMCPSPSPSYQEQVLYLHRDLDGDLHGDLDRNVDE
ncbi:hypothetical protein Q7C36_018647 [Tachysurus vachellii]|uniref:Uncharacterized protein n=1 Tax=Tachysurus vachellii TaxID=175792 RepID=A0AA88LZZ4_TACVA|nr:hypothetical protein Q7C36_018647 [Tachysurus vachellii]